MSNRVQVFEHGTLAVGEQGFNARQFAALVRYNDRHGCAYFKVGHNRLHFGSFVGVVQVGDLAIEILPKLDSESSPDKGKWQRALLQMLRQSGLLTVESAPETDISACLRSWSSIWMRSLPRLSIWLTPAWLNAIA